jgi:hypothetical protein
MKTITKYLLALLTLISISACEYDDFVYYADYTPPAIPSGVVVLNGDNRVDIYWNSNREDDLAGYNIYYSYDYNGRYTLISSTGTNYFIDFGASNGVTYYYAVTAYDYNGNESELSFDVVYATPRPEGFNQSIFDYRRFPNNAGYSFSNYLVVPYDDQRADVFFENYNGTFYLDVWDDTDIQDMGRTNDIYDIPFAPASGWSSTKDAIAKVGHTYVIWTWDNHFAKIRVKQITSDRIVFDWAYQMVEGNRMLKPKAANGERKPLARDFSSRQQSVDTIGE